MEKETLHKLSGINIDGCSAVLADWRCAQFLSHWARDGATNEDKEHVAARARNRCAPHKENTDFVEVAS